MPIQLDDDGWVRPRYLRGLTSDERDELREFVGRRGWDYEELENGDIVVGVTAPYFETFDIWWTYRYPPN
jgi:hypothetical protein